MKLENRVAIVTGAAGAGIGQAIARIFAEEGANVVVSDSHAKRAEKVAEEIKSSYGRDILGIECNVANREHVERMVKETVDKWGRIDILVNNAGINKLSLVVDMDDETWDLVMDVNLKGTFYCSRAVLPYMINQKYGRIVNLSSIVGWLGSGDGEAHYCAAKAGIMAFTKSLAREVGKYNITVNAIAPGLIWNEFLARIYPKEALDKYVENAPLGRAGVPEDIAKAVLFLVSDENSYITGETLCVSGGAFMH
ncbi:MAG: SDR family NAD(P)-dependent oxidoreductase [Candidatus Syntropharchaeia archaeon]